MELKPIKNDEEYEQLLEWIDDQFDQKPEPDSAAGNKLQIALLIIKAYEDVHFQISLPDPIEVIKLKMEEKGLKNKDLVGWVGSKSYVSALLNRKKPMTLKLAKLFHERLGIPAQGTPSPLKSAARLNTYRTYVHVKDGMFEIRNRGENKEVQKKHFSALKVMALWLCTCASLSTDAIKLAFTHNANELSSLQSDILVLEFVPDQRGPGAKKNINLTFWH